MERRQTDIHIQIELNRRMYEHGKITREIYYKAQELLLKRLEGPGLQSIQ